MGAEERRRRWAEGMIAQAAGLEIPVYGSPEFCALPEGHRAKVASVCRAAECWAQQGDDLPESLRAEVEQLRAAHKAAEDAEYVARAKAHREQWRHLRVVRSEDAEPVRDLYDIGAEHMAGGRNG